VAIDAVILDLDGVIVESEELWDAARRELARERGAAWPAEATRAMMGMSPREWSRYMRDAVGVDLDPEEIDREVVRRLMERYRASLPLLPGAVEAVRALAERWPLGLASSSNRPLIDLVLARSGLGPAVRASVSSEEVARGKPAPDVYLEAAARLGVEPSRAVAVEDSANGIRAARAAGLRVVAVPNPRFPPDPDALALAAAAVPGIADVTPELVERVAAIPFAR
jgi:HAD superfamily hydrolase (TIGR01509 family)